MTLVDSLTRYRSSISDVNSFIALAFQRNRSKRFVLPKNQREFISNAAFLEVFIAWETFLESSFIGYMLGESSITGTTIPRFVQPIDEAHARDMLISSMRYFDWGNEWHVRKLSQIHFDKTNPHNAYLSSISQDLVDLKTIRNAAAHIDSTTGSKLDALATRKLNKRCIGMTVPDFIYSLDPNSTTRDTVLTGYLNLLDICAEGIAKG